MAFLTAANRRFLEAVSHLLYANPFLQEMVNFEREALRGEAIKEDALWSANVGDPDRVRANTWLIMKRLTPLLKTLREDLAHGRAAVDTLAQHSAVQYRPYPKHPDYISDLPGSTLNLE